MKTRLQTVSQSKWKPLVESTKTTIEDSAQGRAQAMHEQFRIALI